MNTVAIIPARGGSKEIPGKNIKDFCGRPLLAWSIIQARAAGVPHVLVSSDDDEILRVAEAYGAIPVRRPAELATDTAQSEDALLHALDFWKERQGADPDLVVFLQCTSPVREPEDIQAAIKRLEETGADSLFSAPILDDFCIWKREGDSYVGVTFDPWNRGRRQDREPYYLEDGNIYLFRPPVLRQNRNRFGGKIEVHVLPLWKSHEIDCMEQWDLCSYYFRARLEKNVENWVKRIKEQA